MSRRLRRLLVALAPALLLPTLLAAQTSGLSDDDYLKLGHQYYTWFVGGQADSILAHLAPGVAEQAGGLEGINSAIFDFLGRAGDETELMEEKMTRRMGHPQYWHKAKYALFPAEPLVFRWVLDDEGLITGVGMGPESGTPKPD